MRVLEQHTGMTAHQTLLLEMLKDIDIVCKRRRISYQLFAGTALGAVRHHGFIPWDDDVDIIMSRSEYERFFKEAAKDFDETLYFAQQEHSAHWPMPYSKLRRNNTTCIEKYYPKDLKTHQGVYVDIFPCDNLSDCTLMRKIQFCVLKKSFYGCSNYPECKFTLAEHFRKKKLTKTNVKELLEGKETLVKGIKNKEKKPYNAVVKIGEKGYIDFISFSK